jgi:hypothetical protein
VVARSKKRVLVQRKLSTFYKVGEASLSRCDCAKESRTNFDCDPSSRVLIGVLDCHSVSSSRGYGGVRNRTSRRSTTTCALRRIRPNASQALGQFSFVNKSKNASLMAGRRPSLLTWKTCYRVYSGTLRYVAAASCSQQTHSLSIRATYISNEQPLPRADARIRPEHRGLRRLH